MLTPSSVEVVDLKIDFDNGIIDNGNDIFQLIWFNIL